MSCPSHFTPGKEMQYPLYRWLDGPQAWSELVHKISPTLGFDPQAIQHVASHYTNYHINTHSLL
jgi:hypothetical protein